MKIYNKPDVEPMYFGEDVVRTSPVDMDSKDVELNDKDWGF